MKKAILIVVSLLILFVILLFLTPHDNLFPFEAEYAIWRNSPYDEVPNFNISKDISNQLTSSLNQTSFRRTLGGFSNLGESPIIVFFANRERPTILYIRQDDTLFLQIGNAQYEGKCPGLYQTFLNKFSCQAE